MKTTKEKFKKLKNKTPEELERDIERLTEEIEVRYMSLDCQYLRSYHEHKPIPGNQFFESMYSPYPEGKKLQDALLELKLKNMRELKPKRNVIYELLSFNKDLQYQALYLILDGFEIIASTVFYKGERVKAEQYQDWIKKAEKLKKEMPKRRLHYEPDPLYSLYAEKIAHFYYPEGRGRKPDIQITQFIKQLHKTLSPYSNATPMDAPQMISYIFLAFYGLIKDEKAIKATISQKDSTA